MHRAIVRHVSGLSCAMSQSLYALIPLVSYSFLELAAMTYLLSPHTQSVIRVRPVLNRGSLLSHQGYSRVPSQ